MAAGGLYAGVAGGLWVIAAGAILAGGVGLWIVDIAWWFPSAEHRYRQAVADAVHEWVIARNDTEASPHARAALRVELRALVAPESLRSVHADLVRLADPASETPRDGVLLSSVTQTATFIRTAQRVIVAPAEENGTHPSVARYRAAVAEFIDRAASAREERGRQWRRATDELSTQVGKLDPPRELVERHARLLDALRESALARDAIYVALATPQATGAEAAAARGDLAEAVLAAAYAALFSNVAADEAGGLDGGAP